MNNDPFNAINDFVQGDKKVKETMEVFKRAQKKYDESMNVITPVKSKPRGSNSTSTIKDNYNVYISGTGRGY